jgi:hypothetical protein
VDLPTLQADDASFEHRGAREGVEAGLDKPIVDR